VTAVATNLVADGTVRLDVLPAEPIHTLLFHPVDGGGLLLRNPSTGAWDMHSIADTTLDVYNCTIDGVANQRAKRSLVDIAGQVLGPQSSFADVSVNTATGKVTHIGGGSPAPQWAAGWDPRYARGDALGEKVYFEAQVTIGGVVGVGIISETQAAPLQPFNGAATFGSGTGCFIWYSHGYVFANDIQAVSANAAYVMAQNDTVGLAFDFVHNKAWVRNLTSGNHWWNNSATDDPVTNTGGFSISSLAGKRVIPGCAFFAPVGGTAKLNFGTAGVPPGPFVGVIPSGFTAGWRKPLGAMYDVFASDNGAGGVALELWAVPVGFTNIASDVDTGFKIKTNDPNKRLVGRCGLLLSGNETGFQYPTSTTAKSMVCSYFKPRKRELGLFYVNATIPAEYATGVRYQNNANRPTDQLDWVGFTKWDGITDRLPANVTLHVLALSAPGATVLIGIVRNAQIISSPAYADKGYITGVGSTFLQLPSEQLNDINIAQSLCAGFSSANGLTIPYEALLTATVWE
jgi:hypothetical protein